MSTRAELTSFPPGGWVDLPDKFMQRALEYLPTPDLLAARATCHTWRDFATPQLHHNQIDLLRNCVEPYASSEVVSAEHSNKRRRVTLSESDTQGIVDIATRVLGQSRVQQIVENLDPRSFPALDRLYREVLDVFVCSSIPFLLARSEPLSSLSNSNPLPEDRAEEICKLFNQIEEQQKITSIQAIAVSEESIAPCHQPDCIERRVLRMVPPQVQCFPDLRILNLSGNALSMSAGDVEALLSLPDLQQLVLSDNSLRQIHPSFSHLTRLRYLDLSWNDLSDLPPLNEMEHLGGIDLRGNHFTKIPPTIQGLPNLQFLDLSDNPIEFEEFLNLLRSFAAQGRAGVRVVVNIGLMRIPELLNFRQEILQPVGMDLQDPIFLGHQQVVFELRPRDLPQNFQRAMLAPFIGQYE